MKVCFWRGLSVIHINQIIDECLHFMCCCNPAVSWGLKKCSILRKRVNFGCGPASFHGCVKVSLDAITMLLFFCGLSDPPAKSLYDSKGIGLAFILSGLTIPMKAVNRIKHDWFNDRHLASKVVESPCSIWPHGRK